MSEIVANTTKRIDMGKDFTEFPTGRYRQDGPYSGEVLRDDYIVPALKQHDKVVIKIDSVRTYASSFLQECYGGLVKAGFDVETLKKKLKLEYERPIYSEYEKRIWGYIEG